MRPPVALCSWGLDIYIGPSRLARDERCWGMRPAAGLFAARIDPAVPGDRQRVLPRSRGTLVGRFVLLAHVCELGAAV